MTDAPEPRRPWGFLIALILLAVVVSAVVGYLGIAGLIGGGIPGTDPPAHGIATLGSALSLRGA